MNIKLSIQFCMQWNYAPKAARLAEALLTHYRHEISEFILTPASGGKFEVFINDKLIYSKLDTGLFPKTEEIIEIIEQLKIKD